jgi:hypothetical protein
VVEIVERDSVIVHRNVAETIDAILRGHMVPPEQRWREGADVRAATKYDYKLSETPDGNPTFAALEPTGSFGAYGRGRGAGGGPTGLRPLPGRGNGGREASRGRVIEPSEGAEPRRFLENALRESSGEVAPTGLPSAPRSHRPMSLFGFGVSRKRLEQAVRELGVPVNVARELDEADAVVTLRNYYRRKPAALRDAESGGIPIYVLKTNTIIQMENLLASLFDLQADPSEAALHETADAIGLVQSSGHPMELAPQNAYVRRLQHQMAERNNLMSRSRGTEPNRRVELLPDEGRAWR